MPPRASEASISGRRAQWGQEPGAFGSFRVPVFPVGCRDQRTARRARLSWVGDAKNGRKAWTHLRRVTFRPFIGNARESLWTVG